MDRLKALIQGKRPQFKEQQLRKAKPLRNPVAEWEVHEDGSALISAPLAKTGKRFEKWIQKFAKRPATKTFELEPIGAFVWGMCDGKHTFETMARKLRERYKMNRTEAEAALQAFLLMLNQRGLITMFFPKL